MREHVVGERLRLKLLWGAVFLGALGLVVGIGLPESNANESSSHSESSFEIQSLFGSAQPSRSFDRVDSSEFRDSLTSRWWDESAAESRDV